jgi:adenosylhomocysteine nucleosidase
MLVVKCGMSSEVAVAKKYADPNVLVLSGYQTVVDLQKNVPDTCTAIISFGLCGGLSPQAQIGQAFIYDTICMPSFYSIVCNVEWRKRLFAATKYYECHCWSDGVFNTANTIDERRQLYDQTNCQVIDDETLSVAQFAQARGIPCIGLRVVSDGAEDNLPPAVINALNPDGSNNIEAIIASVISDPEQIPALIKTAKEFELSIAELRTAAIAAGPFFQAP